MHAVAPVEGMKVPAVQSAHMDEDIAPGNLEDVPAGQGVGAADAVPHHAPAGHVRQVLCKDAPIVDEYVPALHGVGESNGQ